MASFNIHLAVAKRYSDKNYISNMVDFYRGVIDPDLEEYEKVLHYTESNRDRKNLISYLHGKTNLPRFLSENSIDTDYNKGVFMHLVTDYIFFNNFFDNNYLNNITYEEFVRDLHYSYDYTNDYLKDKYDVDFNHYEEIINKNISKDKEDKKTKNTTGNNILNFVKLDNFIESISNINLEKYRTKLIEKNINILPDEYTTK
jgi:hypothetical protein